MTINLKPYFDAAQRAEIAVQTLAAAINAHFEAGENDKALELRASLDAAKKASVEANALYLSMRAAASEQSSPDTRFAPVPGAQPENQAAKDQRASAEYSDKFWQAFRVGASPKSITGGMHSAEKFGILLDALTETGGDPAGSEGGFLNPIEFDNRINERTRQFVDVSRLMNVEVVTAHSGWRAVETATALLPFASLAENNDLAAAESPTFTKVPYTLADYGGYLPISNDLLADSPVNIMSYVGRWMGKKVVLTRNSLVFAKLNALTPTVVSAAKDLTGAIKTALNKTLDPAIAASASIIVNQSGFDLLDQLLDGDGRPLMQPDPTAPTRMLYKGRPVTMLADRLWANLSGPARARIAIGGPEYLTIFERSAFEMASTIIGGEAWRKNNTEVRGIMRATVAEIDTAAMCLLTVPVA